MDKANITWYIQNTNKDYIASDTYYAGSYTQSEPLSVTLRIWNNRYGTKEVASLQNLRLNLFFSDMEDSVLLPYISVSTSSARGNASIANHIMTVSFLDNVVISGKANDGTEKNNSENYLDVTIQLDVTGSEARLKAHDLKNLYVEIAE